jgi:dinuclear metal center YbgI/SA1388 family protein
MVRPDRAIGAPRFELGTSPTRTVRATRLRHAPEPGLSQARVAPRAICVERDQPPDPGRHGVDLDVVQEPVGLEDLDSGVDPALEAGAQGVGGGALERLTAHGAAAWANVPGQAILERDPLRHAISVADRAPGRKRVGWQDHPFGGYRWAVASQDEIVAFLDDHLDAGGYPDALPVGLQVIGAAEVRKVATGVSASLELFQRAAGEGAQMLIVHHGLFWNSEPRRVGERERARLRCLFEHDLSLVAYHLALDAHPDLGNNALICRALGLADPVGFGMHGERTIGFLATAAPPLTLLELLDRVRAEINPEPLVFDAGPAAIGRVAVISGAAAQDVLPAADAGADCFLTGEPREPAMAQAREAGIHFVAAGHYATEVFGVRALGDLVAERFGVDHAFIDVPNPI